MDKYTALDTKVGKVSSQSTPQTITKDKAGEGLVNIKKGDQITGTIVAVEDQVTIDFNGQQVTASKEVLKDTAPGDVKTFEVVKVSKNEIELKLLDRTAVNLRQTIKAALIPKKDWETVLSQKEQNAKASEKEQLTKETMNKLQEISTSFTENDCDILEQEGFPIETMTVQGLYQAINRVKAEQNKDDSTKEETPGQITRETVAARLKEENLPVTDKNLSEINKALTMSDTISRIDDKTERYLIDQDIAPTIENIYKAFYSGSKSSAKQKQELTDAAWKELLPQVKAVIQDAGYEISEGNLQDAKWLIENKLPLTEKTFTYKKELDEIKSNVDKEQVLDRIVEGMKNGVLPKDVSLASQDEEALQQIMTDIRSISPEAITYAVYEGIDLTVKKLAAVQDDINNGKINPEEIKTVTKAMTEEKPAEEKNKAEDSRTVEPTSPKDNSTEAEVEIQSLDKTKTSSKNLTVPGPEGQNTKESDAVENKRDEKATEATQINRLSENKVPDVQQQNVVELAKQADNALPIEKGPATETSSERLPEDATIENAAGNVAAGDMEQSQDSGEQGSSSSEDHKQYEAVRAQRQMEEIRLKMTLEAASRLEKKGISIETQKLEKVVEELRKLEESYYRKMLSEAEVPTTEEAVETLKNTTQALEQLRYAPASVIGATLTERSAQTIPGLLTEGMKLQTEYAKAGTAYETLMTVPNAEYGDSIRKAFANMDSLLDELNIDNTEQNKRAVRILGYNQMEITPDAIEQVKAYDTEVSTMIKNLHPAVTVRMIKDGINPLNITISELNDKIDAMKEEQGITSEEKFSTYLHRLEKEEGIAPEERKAYIGIYRLLYNVEKSDGAALGSVIKSDREVTLSNLLTAVQTGRKGRLDAVIDDEFGTLTQMTRNKESIAEQLSGFTKSSSDQTRNSIQNEEPEKETRLEEQTRYLDRVLKQITEELSPDKLTRLTQEASETNSAGSSAITDSSVTAGLNKDVWDAIKNIPAEKLLQKLQQESEQAQTTDGIHTQRVQQLRELCGNAEQSIRFLNDFQMSSTPQNILIANHVLSNGASPIVKLLKRQNENNSENVTDSIKELQDLSDTINDKSSMNEAYASLEEKAKTMLLSACSEETLDSRRIAELRSTAQQMSFLRTMATREFYQIPVETPRGITNINLTILRGTEVGGKVTATIHSEQLGGIKAEFSLKQQTLKGFISCESRTGMEKLQANTEEIEKTAKDNNLTLRQLDFGIWSKETGTYHYQNPENGQQEASAGNQTERMLYRIAKAIVQTVRLAEDSDTEDSRAVS